MISQRMFQETIKILGSLTGQPIVNNLSYLYSLIKYMMDVKVFQVGDNHGN
jgi:hypothetical protein